MLIGWCSWSQRAARVPPRANTEVPPHPGRIRSHFRITKPSVYLQLEQPWDEKGDPSGRYGPARQVAGCLGLMEPARGENCPSGQRRGPATPGEDKVSSPDQQSFHTSTTPTHRGRKRRSPGRYRSARCGNPNPTGWLLMGWRSWSQHTARVAPRANVEVSPHPGRIIFHPRLRNSFTPLQLQHTGEENGDPPGRYRPARCGNAYPTDWLLIGWGSCVQRAARVAPRDNVGVPTHPRRISSHTQIRNPFISLQL